MPDTKHFSNAVSSFKFKIRNLLVITNISSMNFETVFDCHPSPLEHFRDCVNEPEIQTPGEKQKTNKQATDNTPEPAGTVDVFVSGGDNSTIDVYDTESALEIIVENPDALQALKATELRTLSKNLQLMGTGKKSILISRILKYVQSMKNDNSVDEDSDEP